MNRGAEGCRTKSCSGGNPNNKILPKREEIHKANLGVLSKCMVFVFICLGVGLAMAKREKFGT
jgi:hypothetical protein